MFYEHVSRQSTVDTSKHRRGRDLLLQQISFSFHHTSSPVDFGHTVVPPSLLSCVSFSFLLSLYTHSTSELCRANFRPSTQQRNPRASSAPPGSPETPPETHQGDHADNEDFSAMHRKQLAVF